MIQLFAGKDSFSSVQSALSLRADQSAYTEETQAQYEAKSVIWRQSVRLYGLADSLVWHMLSPYLSSVRLISDSICLVYKASELCLRCITKYINSSCLSVTFPNLPNGREHWLHWKSAMKWNKVFKRSHLFSLHWPLQWPHIFISSSDKAEKWFCYGGENTWLSYTLSVTVEYSGSYLMATSAKGTEASKN